MPSLPSCAASAVAALHQYPTCRAESWRDIRPTWLRKSPPGRGSRRERSDHGPLADVPPAGVPCPLSGMKRNCVPELKRQLHEYTPSKFGTVRLPDYSACGHGNFSVEFVASCATAIQFL